jgi:hypothetical protein
MGYDTAEDIPDYYKGNVTANYDLVTVSAPICEPVWQQAMRLPDGVVKALGLARTDKYFDEARNAGLRDKLFNAIPEAKDKKIALYAPSFTGNASSAENKGIESGIDKAFEGRDDWFFIMKPHPHTIDKYKEYMDERLMDMSTDELYASADLFITDYSSALFDYCVYKKPFLLYCPDRDDYAERRGFYVDPDTFPCKLTTSVEELKEVLPGTDVLILSLPGTPDTKGILGKEEMALLPDGAVIINVGRGTSIDQSALEKELLSGRLYAGLDVFEKEPVPAESPLWTCRSLIITPHVAGNMMLPFTVDRIIQMFLEDLDRYCAGKRLLHLADVRAGY